MTATTRLLPRIDDELTTEIEVVNAALPAQASDFEVVPDLCVVEGVVKAFGVSLWRVRLRAISARLRLPVVGADIGATSGRFTAHVSARPQFASLPLTLGWFLPSVPRSERIDIVVAEFPDVTEPGEVDVLATVSVAEYGWEVPLRFRFVVVDEDALVVAITGAVPRAAGGPFPAVPMRIDAAMELRRCE